MASRMTVSELGVLVHEEIRWLGCVVVWYKHRVGPTYLTDQSITLARAVGLLIWYS